MQFGFLPTGNKVLPAAAKKEMTAFYPGRSNDFDKHVHTGT